jgi:tRNA threonylcarbamoyladenosine biosynthesis protein TsaB
MLVAIDTSTDHASLALHDGLQVRAEHTWESPRRHTVELLPRLAATLDQLGLNPKHLSGVAVARGPGSFTGLRVGIAVAKGLALARGLPIIGVPTLDTIAEAQGKSHRTLYTVLKAGRGRICVATYCWKDNRWQPKAPPRLCTWQKLVKKISTPTLFCGEISQQGAAALATLGSDLAKLLPAAARLRRAGFLAEIAWRRLNQSDTDDPATLAPIYLQHPV